MLNRRMALCLAIIITGCKSKEVTPTLNPSASAGAIAQAPEPAPAPKTPKELFEDYQHELGKVAEEGRYDEVCHGAPWFPPIICQWVAARAQGKAVDRPDSDVFRNLFGREHWKHAYGTIIDEAGDQGDYEVAVGGYRVHCLLDTADTKFTTKGRFNMWVQEQPETREVTLNSGKTANWVVLSEAPLAKALMDLAHSYTNLETTAIAKDAMKLIAEYDSYAVLKGSIPAVPEITATSVSGSVVRARAGL